MLQKYTIVLIVKAIIPRYFDFIAQIIRVIRDHTGIKIPKDLEIIFHSPTIDERLQKIDEAKEALRQGITAIDELKFGAEQNKHELESALLELNDVKHKHKLAESELDRIRQVMRNDIAAFRAVAGIPNTMKERMIGFVSGVVASVFASLIWVGASIAIDSWRHDTSSDTQLISAVNQQD